MHLDLLLSIPQSGGKNVKTFTRVVRWLFSACFARFVCVFVEIAGPISSARKAFSPRSFCWTVGIAAIIAPIGGINTTSVCVCVRVYYVCVSGPCVCVAIKKIFGPVCALIKLRINNRSIWPCHPSYSMTLALVLPRWYQYQLTYYENLCVCVCVYSSHYYYYYYYYYLKYYYPIGRQTSQQYYTRSSCCCQSGTDYVVCWTENYQRNIFKAPTRAYKTKTR